MIVSQNRELLKRTTSRCPSCHHPCPAEVWKQGESPAKVFLTRQCPDHGEATVCLASDARFYWLSKGTHSSEEPCGCGTGNCGLPNRFETLSTCLALIEIVHSCNLACPTCYADSPLGKGDQVQSVPLGELKSRVQGVIDRKGAIDILQLSGGEPTLHPQFFELLEWSQKNPGIKYVLINTNGVRIAQNRQFAAELKQLAAKRKIQLYLQFDGPRLEGQMELRGADLRAVRQQCLRTCEELQLPVTLAMTVTPQNLSQLWESVQIGLKSPTVHGITFQPQFLSGRNNFQLSLGARPVRLNTADLILAVVEQSQGKLGYDDFTPLPCGDPNCATIGYLLRDRGETRSLSQFLDYRKLQGFLENKLQYTLEDLQQCGCESEPLGHLLKQLELKSEMTFRIMIKPFMDSGTWDEDRIDRCCTHVIRPDGTLDSFCRYYSQQPVTSRLEHAFPAS